MQIASMILGIISIVPLSFLGISGPVGFIGTACALAAIVLAAIGLKKNEKKGFCIAGLITGIFGLLISLIITISCTICYHKIDQAVKSGELDGLTESLKSLGSTLESTDTSSTDWEALGDEFSKNLSDGLKGVVDGVEGGVKNGLNDLGNALKSLGDSLSN